MQRGKIVRKEGGRTRLIGRYGLIYEGGGGKSVIRKKEMRLAVGGGKLNLIVRERRKRGRHRPLAQTRELDFFPEKKKVRENSVSPPLEIIDLLNSTKRIHTHDNEVGAQ